MYKKKGLGVLWAEKKETSRRLVLLHVGFRTFNITARWVPDVMFFLPARRVPDMHRLELYVRFRRLDTSKKINSAEQKQCTSGHKKLSSVKPGQNSDDICGICLLYIG